MVLRTAILSRCEHVGGLLYQHERSFKGLSATAPLVPDAVEFGLQQGELTTDASPLTVQPACLPQQRFQAISIINVGSAGRLMTPRTWPGTRARSGRSCDHIPAGRQRMFHVDSLVNGRITAAMLHTAAGNKQSASRAIRLERVSPAQIAPALSGWSSEDRLLR